MFVDKESLMKAMMTNRQVLVVNKSSNSTSVGHFNTLWNTATAPGSGGNSPATLTVPTRMTAGAFQFSPARPGNKLYIAGIEMIGSNTGSDVQILDRLAHIGGFSADTTVTQIVNAHVENVPSARLGANDLSDIVWFLEVTTVIGATTATAAVSYTTTTNETGTLSIQMSGSNQNRRIWHLYPDDGKTIRRIDSVTLSTGTGAAGNFGFVAARPITAVSLGLGRQMARADWSNLCLPQVHDDACLFMITMPSSSSTGTIAGTIILVEG